MAVTTKVETITPKRAQEYLDRFTSNRRERKKHVDRLADAIKKDRFKLTHQGIACNCDGATLDGWHRLRAVVQAGKPVKMLVTKGLPRDAMPAIDQGKNRDISDVAHTMGIRVTPQMAAASRAMIIAFEPSNLPVTAMTTEELLEFTQEHLEALDFASCREDFGPRKHASFRAVIARAWYTVDRERLQQFLDICHTGIPLKKADHAAISIRDFYLKCKPTLGCWDKRAEMYAKTETALTAFLKGETLTRLYAAKEELFLLPGENS